MRAIRTCCSSWRSRTAEKLATRPVALYETLQQYPGYMDQIVIGTFHDEIEEELQTAYPDLFRGASVGAARKFILNAVSRRELL